LNNNFSSLVDGIKQGRIVFDNLKKVIAYLLPAGSWSEMLPVVVNVFFGAPLALSPFLMIVICMLTDVFASLALVHERAESDIMKRRPRNPAKDRMVNWKLLLYSYGFIGMLECVTAFLIFRWHMARHGYPQNEWLLTFSDFPTDPYTTEVVLEGQSVFFVVLVVLQIGNLFTTRTRFVPVLPIPQCIRNCAQAECLNSVCNRAPTCERCKRHDRFAPIIGQKEEKEERVLNLDQEDDQDESDVSTHSVCPHFFQRGGRNSYIFMACTASLLSAVFFTEIKVCQDTFGTRHVEAMYWFVSVCFAIILFFLGEMRKWIMELWPKGIVAKLAW